MMPFATAYTLSSQSMSIIIPGVGISSMLTMGYKMTSCLPLCMGSRCRALWILRSGSTASLKLVSVSIFVSMNATPSRTVGFGSLSSQLSPVISYATVSSVLKKESKNMLV